MKSKTGKNDKKDEKARKGQFMGMKNLPLLAIAIIALAIVLGVGTLILDGVQNAGADENTITDERENLTGALPQNYDLDEASTDDFLKIEENSETIVLQNSTTNASSNTTLSDGTDYNISYESGTIWILNSTTTFNNYNDPGSVTWNDYTELTTNDVTGILGTGKSSMIDFADFLSIIIIIGIAAAIFLLLGMMRRTGQQASS